MAENHNVYSKKIKARADEVNKKVAAMSILKGHGKYAIAAACLYFACKEDGQPRSCKEIQESNKKYSKISKKEIGRCFKLVEKGLDVSTDVSTSDEYVIRYATNLGLPENVTDAAMTIAKRAVHNDLVLGRSPVSIAAAAIYMASQASTVQKSRKEVAEEIKIAEVTIRQVYHLIYPQAEELFPEDFDFHVPFDQLPMG